MKCTISSVFLLVSVFNWGWIEDFKHNASIYNLKKNHIPKKCTDISPHGRQQNWELPIMHMFCVNLWTFIDLCNLSGAFSDPVSNVYLNLLEIVFPTRGQNYIWKNWLYAHFLCRSVMSWWHVTQKKVYFYLQWPLLGSAQRKWSIFVKYHSPYLEAW